jgi:hypothetical protein
MPLIRTAFARKRVNRFLEEESRTCTITHPLTSAVVYTGVCRLEKAEADQGQITEPDPAEAGVSEYDTWKVYLPFPEGAGVQSEGDVVVSADPITGRTDTLVITTIETNKSTQTEIQLEAVKQRSSSELINIVLIRIDPNTGAETALSAQPVRVVLDGPVPIGASPAVPGGDTDYILGTMIFPDRNANVLAGDRFRYLGRFGEITGIPTIAPDRKEARIRIAGGS